MQVTMICAVTPDGDAMFVLVKGSTNQFVFMDFLQKMRKELDKRDPDWRKDHVVILDNCALHKTPKVLQYLDNWSMPHKFTAPASFKANPIEMVFAHFKRQFAAIMQQRIDERNVLGNPGADSLKNQEVTAAIQKAVNQTPCSTIRKVFPSQLSHLREYLEKVL